MIRITRVAGIVALGLAMSAAGPAIAQTQSSQAGQVQSAMQSAQNFSQAELQKFVTASNKIRSIQQWAKHKMTQAQGRQAVSQIRKQARQKMLSAIKNSGLTLKQYNQIARAARSNPKLAKKIEQMRR